MELVNLIDERHELVKLASLIEWSTFAGAWGPRFHHRAPGAGYAADGSAAGSGGDWRQLARSGRALQPRPG